MASKWLADTDVEKVEKLGNVKVLMNFNITVAIKERIQALAEVTDLGKSAMARKALELYTDENIFTSLQKLAFLSARTGKEVPEMVEEALEQYIKSQKKGRK